MLELVVEGDRHQEVLSVALRGLARFLQENRLVFRAQLGDASPAWVPDWVDDRVFDRVFAGLQAFLEEVGDDPRHELRRAYDARLRAYVHALRTDPDTAARVEELKKELLEHPAVRTWSGSLWTNAKNAVLTRGRRPGLRAAVPPRRAHPGRRPARCRPTRPSASWCSGTRTASRAISSSGSPATSPTWSAARSNAGTPRRPASGSSCRWAADLQWIRVNGTVVGGLAGLVIYTVAQLLG